MNKKNLKLAEFFQLDAELNGVVNQQTGEKVIKGLLSQKLPLNVKYWLADLAKKTAAEKAACEELRGELIKKYGEEKDGNFQVTYTIVEDGKDVLNPKFVEFQKEYDSLLNEEKELEYKELKLSDLGEVETDETYVMLFSLLKPE